MNDTISRRDFLRLTATVTSGAVLTACAPRVVEVTKEVIKEVPVEQTVVVEREVEVEKEVTAVPTNLEEFELRVGTFNSPVVNPVTDMLIAGFGAKYPNARVKIEYQVGDYAEKMYTMVAAGNLPDVIWTCDVFTFPFARRGVLLDMQPLAEADEEFNLDDVYPSILELGRVAGEPGLYMIPASLDVVVVFYNKTAFERVGAPLPTNDWTEQQFIEACQMVTAEKDADGMPLMYGWDGAAWSWIAIWGAWVFGYGGDILSEDGKTSTLSRPETLDGLQAYVDQWHKHQIAKPVGVDVGGDAFILEKAATTLNIPGMCVTYRENIADKFEWDVVRVPAHPKGAFTGMGTYGYAVSSNTQRPQAAWDFVKYLASPTGQSIIARSYAGIPLLKSMANDPTWRELPPPPANKDAFVLSAEIGIRQYVYPEDCGSIYAGLVAQTISTALEKAIRGDEAVPELFTQADADIQACLDEAFSA